MLHQPGELATPSAPVDAPAIAGVGDRGCVRAAHLFSFTASAAGEISRTPPVQPGNVRTDEKARSTIIEQMSLHRDESKPSTALLCFDGSQDAEAAISKAGELLGPRPAVVLTVWEPLRV